MECWLEGWLGVWFEVEFERVGDKRNWDTC